MEHDNFQKVLLRASASVTVNNLLFQIFKNLIQNFHFNVNSTIFIFYSFFLVTSLEPQ